MSGARGARGRTLPRTQGSYASARGGFEEGITMVRDLLGQAYGAMKHDRRRTTLTMLGMAWGIATVVLLLAYGAGFGRAINAIFANWGTKVIGVWPNRTSLQAGGTKAGSKIQFKIDDVDYIASTVPLVKHISPAVY